MVYAKPTNDTMACCPDCGYGLLKSAEPSTYCGICNKYWQLSKTVTMPLTNVVTEIEGITHLEDCWSYLAPKPLGKVGPTPWKCTNSNCDLKYSTTYEAEGSEKTKVTKTKSTISKSSIDSELISGPGSITAAEMISWQPAYTPVPSSKPKPLTWKEYQAKEAGESQIPKYGPKCPENQGHGSMVECTSLDGHGLDCSKASWWCDNCSGHWHPKSSIFGQLYKQFGPEVPRKSEMPNSLEYSFFVTDYKPAGPSYNPNFWLEAEFDGKKQKLKGGSQGENGGVVFSVFQNDNGNPKEVMRIRGFVEGNQLKLEAAQTASVDIKSGGHSPIFKVKTTK